MNILRKLRQKAVYWPPAGGPAETGQQGFMPPVEIACRWEDDVSLQLEASTSNNWMSKARVYVDRPVEVDGVLWLGEFKFLTDKDVPFANRGASRIRRVTTVPDKRATARGTLRTAVL